MMVHLQNVRRTWPGPEGDVVALDLAELTVRRTEHLAILGHNGSGKTTLLHVLAGLLAPDAGRVVVAGQDLTALREHQLDRFRARTIGFLPHSGQLLDALTAAENVMLPLLFAGVPRREHRARAREALERFGVAHRARHRPSQLSAGERQRVGLARAVVADPPLLLVDEPSVNLDPETSASITGDLVQRCTEAGTTLVLVTHHPETVVGMRTLRLDHGHEVAP